MTATLDIRTASRDEVGRLLDMAAAEGWNPGLADLDAFHAADPDGFIVGLRDGRLAAGVSVVRYGADFAFLGLYICAPAWRGMGYGIAVWNEAIRRMQARTIGLDGVVAQQANYRKSGFALAFRNIRFGGQVTIEGADDPRITGAVPAGLDVYDTRHFGAPRPQFLATWLRPDSGRVIRVLIEDGLIRGYGVIRPCRTGFKIGPLFAADADHADALFCALARRASGSPLWLDIPELNRAAFELAERHGLIPEFETARMYRGNAPELPLHSIFGITTFELG